jgi:prepilin-type N-terminal cleavage/methylation domain-containing protein
LTRAPPRATLRAMTLTEILVTLALVGVLTAASVTLLEHGQRAWTAVATRAETQQTARVALARIVADVRAAGFGGEAFEAVAVAEPQRLVLQQDLDGDGAPAAPGERVTWRLAGSVLRRDAGGGAQPIANGVRALEFRYQDATGGVAASPGAVRSIAVTMTTEPERAPASSPFTATLSTLIRLRNR